MIHHPEATTEDRGLGPGPTLFFFRTPEVPPRRVRGTVFVPLFNKTAVPPSVPSVP